MQKRASVGGERTGPNLDGLELATRMEPGLAEQLFALLGVTGGTVGASHKDLYSSAGNTRWGAAKIHMTTDINPHFSQIPLSAT